MTTMTQVGRNVTLGVDTHKDAHVAAVLDDRGAVLATQQFKACPSGYRSLMRWAAGFGTITVAGIEGTGSWGAGLCRFLDTHEIQCVEVNRPNRQHRRRHGKSDTADAVGAARAVQSGEATGQPRGNNGGVEGLRVIRCAHRSAVKARTQAINQLRSLISTAPDEIQTQFASATRDQIVHTAARFRPSDHPDPINTTKHAMRSIARRVEFLNDEINELETRRTTLAQLVAPPELLAETGVGPSVASDLLIAFGDNTDRIHNERSFAALCGVSPIDASSGRQHRHRLNRGGDRYANNALWRITMVRLSCHPETQDFAARTIARGKTKRETIRILKRYIARRIWKILYQHHLDNP